MSDRCSHKTHYLQLNHNYIVTTVKSGLLVIDQHLAHYRILFEKFLKELETNEGHSQQELFPQPFTLNANDLWTYWQGIGNYDASI